MSARSRRPAWVETSMLSSSARASGGSNSSRATPRSTRAAAATPRCLQAHRHQLLFAGTAAKFYTLGYEYPLIGAAAPDVLVGCSISMSVDSGLASCRRNHVDVRVIGGIVVDSGPDLQNPGVTVGAVLQAMTVGVASREPGGVAWAKHFFGHRRSPARPRRKGRKRTRRHSCASDAG